jgi:hypothetical protein
LFKSLADGATGPLGDSTFGTIEAAGGNIDSAAPTGIVGVGVGVRIRVSKRSSVGLSRVLVPTANQRPNAKPRLSGKLWFIIRPFVARFSISVGR